MELSRELLDYKRMLDQQIRANPELSSAMERLAGRTPHPSKTTVRKDQKPVTENEHQPILQRWQSLPNDLNLVRNNPAQDPAKLQQLHKLEIYVETFIHRIGRATDGPTVLSVGVVITRATSNQIGVISAKLPNGDVGEYTYTTADILGKPFPVPVVGELVYFAYPNRSQKEHRYALLVISVKHQSASWYGEQQHRERGIVLRVMRHQGGVYIGTEKDNTVMFAPFRSVVHPCQYTRRGDQVEFNIPSTYVAPKDTSSFNITDGLVNVCVVPTGSLWEGTLSEEKIVGYVSKLASPQNDYVGSIQFLDEKKITPDQSVKMSTIAFSPKDVNYDHSSLVKLNHKVSFRILNCGEKRGQIAVNIGIEEGLEKFRGHIVAVCNGYGFIEHEHLTDIWFHFTRLRPGVDGRKLRVGCLVEYSLLPQKPDRSGLQACQVQPLTHQLLPGYARLEDENWYVGVVERALRNTNPAQSHYHGLIRTRTSDQDEVYLFSMSGIVRKSEILQVGDRVKFQVGLDGQTTLRRAVNILRTVYVLQVKTLRENGEFGFLFFGGQDLFFHSSQIRNRMRPHQGDWVECALAKDRHGRLCASSLRILHPREVTRELYEKAMTINPRLEGDFPRPQIPPRSSSTNVERDFEPVEEYTVEHCYGSSSQPKSHTVPREPHWLVVVPDLFRDTCKNKASQIKIPKSLYDAWLNGKPNTFNVPVAVRTTATPKEIGDFERNQSSDTVIAVAKSDVEAHEPVAEINSAKFDKGDGAEIPLRSPKLGRKQSDFFSRSQVDPQKYAVRASKSYESGVGTSRPLSRF